MNLQFINLKLDNFGSYNTAEVSLKDRGFCIVSGQNRYKKDNAMSNGAGKSTIWSAICYALTGETIAGNKSNLKNIYTDSAACSVTLEFSVDSDSYCITRISDPKSDLKIIKNGIDISGKGIRESEKILAESLPNLTKNLISSIIILGQGMPNKFSSFSPSGRKELLEKLTNSDFMIEDIKARIQARQDVLLKQVRELEDSLLINSTQLTLEKTTLDKQQLNLQQVVKQDFKSLISATELIAGNITKSLDKTQSSIKLLEQENEQKNQVLLEATTKKAKENADELQAYLEKYNMLIQQQQNKLQKKAYLMAEIDKLKHITDICPTCGQKIPGVLIPDTTGQEQDVAQLQKDLAEVEASLANINIKHQNYLATIDDRYKYMREAKTTIDTNKIELINLKNQAAKLASDQAEINTKLNQLYYDKQNTEQIINSLTKSISEQELKVNQLSKTILILNQAKADLEEHLAVVKKIETLVKRDFRGYLLYNIIAYLDTKAKEYSKIVFGTNELNICLDGNVIDISYCNKAYENLSGGEKQRVDLIIQFAIRELLQSYFSYNSNILVLDEITDNLDKVATDRIFDLISNKLKNIESVFIISHHPDELGEIPIDSTLQIIKNEVGISEIYTEL